MLEPIVDELWRHVEFVRFELCDGGCDCAGAGPHKVVSVEVEEPDRLRSAADGVGVEPWRCQIAPRPNGAVSIKMQMPPWQVAARVEQNAMIQIADGGLPQRVVQICRKSCPFADEWEILTL